MTAYTIATHPVKNFETWTATFDGGLEMRTAAGTDALIDSRLSENYKRTHKN